MVGQILLIAAFILTLLWSFYKPEQPYYRFPHLGWLGVALGILALVLGTR